MRRFLSAAAVALCVLTPMCTHALAAGYTIPAPGDPDYAKPTSVDYVYSADGGARANEDRSKDAAFLPPDFGAGGIYPLNAIGTPLTVNGASSAIGGGATVYPGSLTAYTICGASAFTDVTGDLKYTNGSLGTLNIPAIGLTVGIYEGTDSASLAKGAGHFSETSIWDGNVALAAHNRGVNNYFGQIHTLSIGDTVTLTTKLGTRIYAVTGVSKVSETDRNALAASSDNRLTLYTCVMDQRSYRWCVQAEEVR